MLYFSHFLFLLIFLNNRLMDLELKFNWIDLIALLILIRIIYIAVSRGFVIEFFKTLGSLGSLFFSFQFYENLGEFFLKYFHFLGEFSKLVSFLLIYGVGWLVIKYIRVILIFLFKVEAHSLIERWFSLFLGIFRASLLISITFFLLHLLNIEYLNKSLESSFSFYLLKNLAPKTYVFLGNSVEKIAPAIEVKSLEEF